MSNDYHSRNELDEKSKKELPMLIDELDSNIQEFISYKNEIQELLQALHTCLHTSGGVERIKKLADINTELNENTKFLSSIVDNDRNITINYETIKKYI